MRILLLLAFSIAAYAQPYILGVQYTNVDPSPTCTIRSILISNYANGKLWQCQSGTYVNIAGGGGGGGTIAVTTDTLAGDGAGNAVAITGSPTDCVLVNGSSTPCASGTTIAATTNIIKGDGTGNGSDSGYVAQNASTSLTGFLTSTDWNTFNGKGSVSSVATGCGASGGTITTTGTILGIGDCVTIANETGTGTTTNKLVKLTGAPSKAIITGTGDTTGIIGVCDSACGNTGSAVIQQSGLHITTVDGSGSTAGHWAQPSTSIAGDTMDSGVASTSAPPAGSIGIYLQTFGGLSTVVTDLINNLAGSASSGGTSRTFGANFTNGGNALGSGYVTYFTFPFGCTISAWNITISPADTATFDIWKIATGTAIPTVTNSIVASAAPAIASGTAVHSTTLTSWTTTVTANDIFGIKLQAVGGTATQTTLNVECN